MARTWSATRSGLATRTRVIEDCQTALKRLGYVTFKPDGIMGKATVAAIKAFQQANGLTRGRRTRPRHKRDMILSGEAQEMVMQLGDYGTDVKNMQTRLAKLNYLSRANATGYFGEITEGRGQGIPEARWAHGGRQSRRRDTDHDELLQCEKGRKRAFHQEGEQYEFQLVRQFRQLVRQFVRQLLQRRF